MKKNNWQMNWHKQIILKNAKEIIGSGITYLSIALVLLLWRFVLGFEFQWQDVNPLSEPSIFVRSFYSAFTFATLGSLLYLIGLYKGLHDILVKTFGLWEIYNSIKAIIWLLLMYISYTYLVPWLFDTLNAGISILFNVANLFLYLLPPVGGALILSATYYLLKRKLALKS